VIPPAPSHIAPAGAGAQVLQHAVYTLLAGSGRGLGPRTACEFMRAPLPQACGHPVEGVSPRPAASISGWSLTGPNPPPQVPTAYELTYDAWDRYVLLLGMVPDLNSSGGITDTWAYQGGNWTPITTSTGPVGCSGSNLAYDSADGYVVYFGGAYVGYSSYACPSAGQTWTYRSGAWTQLTPSVAPSVRTGASMADDPGDGYVVLYGGQSSSCNYLCNDTWEFLGGVWTKLAPPVSPTNRSMAGLAYDAKDGYLLLFGGMGSYSADSDTWNFSRGAWTHLYPTGTPPVPQPDALSYDTADQEIIYTTAYNWNGTTLETTWSYVGGVWSPVNYTVGPPQRLDAATADDVHDGYLLFFGGLGYTYRVDSWSFLAGTWTNRTATQPSPRQTAAVTYDGADGYLLLFGGKPCPYVSGGTCPDLGDTWTYLHGVWTELFPSPAPSPRDRAGLVYDAADGYVLLFGGVSTDGHALNDTWEFSAGTWTQIFPTVAPSPRSAGTMVYDGADAYVLLFGGDTNTSYPYAGRDARDTWSFHGGAWTNLTTTLTIAPPAEATNRLVYDAADGYVLLFGTYAGTVSGISPGNVQWGEGTNQTWKYASGAWTNVTATTGGAPPPRTDAAVIYDVTTRQVVLFGGTSTPGTWLGDTWAFSGGLWSQLLPSTAPFNRSGAAFEYDTADAVAVLLGGTSGYYPLNYASPNCQVLSNYGTDLCGDRWIWGGIVGSSLSVAAFRVSPAQVDLGITAQITSVAVGGAPPYTYSYGGLPAGCASSDTSILNCLPTAVGTYVVTLTVQDSGTNLTRATLTFTVRADPSFTSFVAVPASITVGNATVFRAVLTGGVAPFNFTYLGLPSGCNSSSTPLLPCTPHAAGSYSIALTATDADGVRSVAQTTLLVQSAGSHGGPSIVSFLAGPPTIVLGNTTILVVTTAAGSGNLAYGYAGLPPGCGTLDQATLTCSPTAAGTFDVQVTVTATNGSSTSVGTNVTVEPAGGGADPLVTAFGAVPDPVVVGATTVLAVDASGTAAPLTYRYAGLPPGCPSANLSVLPCDPSIAGSFAIEVIVQDTLGHVTGVLAHLVVEGGSGVIAPSVTAFYPDPSTVAVGSSTVLDVATKGGSLPLTYVYEGLPPGCTSANTPTLPCSPTTVGVYRIGVNVTDGVGVLANATTILTVHAASSSSNNSGATSSTDPYLLVGAGALAGIGATALVGALLVVRGRRPPTGAVRRDPSPDPPG
jgi:Galactose oxidase, central domain